MVADAPQRKTMSFGDALNLLVSLRDQTAGKADEVQAFVNFCLNNIGWSRAQHLQDLWVAYELKSRRNGYFVEFGAMDGVIFSNTYGLETHLDWNGVVAEPARIWHPAINDNRRCAVDRRCVWIRSGETLRFNQTEITGLSTIDAYSDKDGHAEYRTSGQRYDVETVSLNDLLGFWHAPRRIDYLSIDTEGSELDILESFDWRRHEIHLISIEHNHTDQRPRIFDFLSAKGYRRKFEQLSFADDWYVLTY